MPQHICVTFLVKLGELLSYGEVHYNAMHPMPMWNQFCTLWQDLFTFCPCRSNGAWCWRWLMVTFNRDKFLISKICLFKDTATLVSFMLTLSTSLHYLRNCHHMTLLQHLISFSGNESFFHDTINYTILNVCLCVFLVYFIPFGILSSI